MVFEPRWNRHDPAKVSVPTVKVRVKVVRPDEQAAAGMLAPARLRQTETVREMRDRGLTVQQIVNSLRARHVVRPDGKPWSSHMVENLLARGGTRGAGVKNRQTQP
nr:recombinase family protein [uncultured Lichenicoccus sp.]